MLDDQGLGDGTGVYKSLQNGGGQTEILNRRGNTVLFVSRADHPCLQLRVQVQSLACYDVDFLSELGMVTFANLDIVTAGAQVH